MGLLEAALRIVELGGEPERAASVAEMRSRFEDRTGTFTPEDSWFEERSRAFWADALTRERFGRQVEQELTSEQSAWLSPLERAHRGLFRVQAGVLVDIWSGAELIVTLMDDASRAELESAAGQLFDGRVVGYADAKPEAGYADAKPEAGHADAKPEAGDADAKLGTVVALLPGSVFHPHHATPSIAAVLHAARQRELKTHEVLDALLRMEQTLRSLSRVKAAYAYRPDALTPRPLRAGPTGKQVERPGSPRV